MRFGLRSGSARDNGSLDDLALDIQEHGLLNPITVMEQADGGYVLIAGLRRLKAMEQTGETDIRATVMSPMEADEILLLEISENEQRKDFTTAERLAFAERIQAVETEKGKQRRLRKPRETADFEVGNCPPQTERTSRGGKSQRYRCKESRLYKLAADAQGAGARRRPSRSGRGSG